MDMNDTGAINSTPDRAAQTVDSEGRRLDFATGVNGGHTAEAASSSRRGHNAMANGVGGALGRLSRAVAASWCWVRT